MCYKKPTAKCPQVRLSFTSGSRHYAAASRDVIGSVFLFENPSITQPQHSDQNEASVFDIKCLQL
jgi:hypothetical protein